MADCLILVKEYLNKKASDHEMIEAGRRAILFSFISGVTIGILLLYLKFSDPDAAFTHTLNELRYYINCGIVVIICAAVFLVAPNHRITFITFLSTIIFQFLFKYFFLDMNYFIRAMWIILLGFTMIYILSKSRIRNSIELFHSGSKQINIMGVVLLISLIFLHIIFH